MASPPPGRDRALTKAVRAGAATIPFLGILMDVFWVYPWLVWAGQLTAFAWQRPPLAFFSAVVLGGVACFSARLFMTAFRRLLWVRLGVVGTGLVTMLLVLWLEYGLAGGPGPWHVQIGTAIMESFSRVRPATAALAAGAILWWRGLTWGITVSDFKEVYRRFRAGLAATVMLIILWAVTSSRGASGGVTSAGLYVAGFFFCALSALALANLQTVRRDLAARGQGTPGPGREWLTILFGLVGGMTVLGMLLASIFSFDFVTLIGGLLASAADVLALVLYYLLLPVGFLVALLVYAGRFIVSLLRREPPQPLELPDLSRQPKPEEEAVALGLHPNMVVALKWAAFALVAAAVVFLVVRAVMRQMPARTREGVEESHESLWSWQTFKADVHAFFAALWRRLRPRSRSGTARAPAVAPLEMAEPGRLSVRDAYRYLLREAAETGLGRDADETPYEYRGKVVAVLPEAQSEMAEMTDLYVAVRYGEAPQLEAQVDRANGLLDVLRRLLRPPEAPPPA